MANVLAVIWDFDKTLVNGYMQDPIFEKYQVDPMQFWNEVNALPKKYKDEQNVRVNPDTIYLNHFIHCAENGTFPGLNNAVLRESGKDLKFYPGVPEIFEATRAAIEEKPEYQKYDIKVEHYIVSTGMREVILGSIIADKVNGVWGCELIEKEDPNNPGQTIIGELGYTIDNTSKTRAIFEINKGKGVDVNVKLAHELRRVPFENMIYIADGPSDIPAFALVHHNGGSTFAIYPPGHEKEFAQVEQLREDGRIDMFAEADYSIGKPAYMWIVNKLREYAERICKAEKDKMPVEKLPQHIR